MCLFLVFEKNYEFGFSSSFLLNIDFVYVSKKEYIILKQYKRLPPEHAFKISVEKKERKIQDYNNFFS